MVWKIGLLAFLTGFFSLCVQVVATQLAFYSQPQSSHAIGLSLCAFLTGLGVAARLTNSRQAFLQKHFRSVIAIAFGGVGIFFLALVIRADNIREVFRIALPILLSDPYHHYLATVVSQSLIFLLIPALGLGLLFPLINDRIALHQGTQTGAITSIDYLGAGLGSLFCAFILIPHLGMKLAGVIVAVMLVLLAIAAAPNWTWRGVAALSLLFFISFEFPSFYKTLRSSPDLSTQVLFEKPSAYGTVRVTRYADGHSSLHINGRSMCYSRSNRSERLLAEGPLKDLKSKSASALNIGLGCGFTALQFKNHPKVRELDIVEINPVVVTANSHFELNLLGDFGAKTQIHVFDGFSFLESSKKIFDVIAVDVEEPSIIHSSPLFTADFFTLVRNRLNKDGVFTVWTFNQPESGKIILNTLKSVFAFADVLVVNNKLVFFAADHDIDTSKLRNHRAFRRAILDMPQTEIATIAKNPYPKYFKVNEVFNFPSHYQDKFEIRAGQK